MLSSVPDSEFDYISQGRKAEEAPRMGDQSYISSNKRIRNLKILLYHWTSFYKGVA